MTINSELQSLLAKIAIGVATAATIGAGGTLIAGARTNAVQDQRITVLEKTSEQMEDLSDKLDETNKNVAVLNERLDRSRGK